MHKLAKRLFFSLALITICYGLGRLYYFLTDGFCCSNVTRLPLENEATPLCLEQQEKISSILSQEFHYLSKGGQSYVFASADDRYVIKFFKAQNLAPPAGLSYLPFLLEESAKRRADRLHKVFQALSCAFNKMPNETALVHVQLAKNRQLPNKLILYDKLHMRHQLDPTQIGFVIQYKAIDLPSFLEKASKEEAVCILTHLREMLALRAKRGICDADHRKTLQNLGVLDGRVIFLDPGQFATLDLDAKEQEREVAVVLEEVHSWLAGHRPDLLEALP